MATKIDYVTSWTARLQSRLYTQFKSAVTWQQWAAMLGQQFQDLEDAAQTFFTLFSIDDSVGVQLDTIGRLVGQVRAGIDDATYRLYLKTRVLANRSTGTPEELYKLFITMLGSTVSPRYFAGFIKQFALRLTNLALTRTQALVAAQFLKSAREAGTRGVLEWQENVDSLMFSFDGAPCLTTALAAGGVVFTVDVTSTAGFPASGTVILSGAGGLESFTYSSITGNSFNYSGFFYTPGANHPIGEPVTQTGLTLGTGLGFDQGTYAGAIST